MAVAIGSDGKTYGAGFILDGTDQMFAVARLDAQGRLDPTFGTNGVASVNVAVGGRTGELARAVAIQSSGKIIIGGPVEHDPTAAGDAGRDTDVAVARFDSAGKIDTTFGTNGVAKVDIGTGRITTGTTFAGDTSWGLGSLPGDKVVIFGTTLPAGDRTDADFVLVGLTSAGQLDSSFGSGGKLIVDGDGNKSADNPRNLLVQPDGKILASGYSNIGGVVTPLLIRTSSSGQLDTAFGRNGIAANQVLPGVAEAYSVSQQGDNYILAGYGRGADTAEKVDMIVYRFTGTGALDRNFGQQGLFRLDIAKEDDRARNVIVLPDQRILAIGSGKRDATDIQGMIVLLSKDGAPDASFGEAGHLIIDLGGPNDSFYGVAVSPDKKFVIVAGYKGVDPAGASNDVHPTAWQPSRSSDSP
jgi:uncharacterized delta-60 repeat protein